ncbi:MAG: hypothetical protein IIX14_02340 [Clostridia bacterium]|jgi:ABC-type multidrug transport system fused ATPase/permease subunit|nr:hypothetical protein [Clostridia bacterium]
MANCPKCGYKLRMIDIKAECPKCGVNLIYFNHQERLAEDADKAEEEYIRLQPKIDRVKFAFIGTKLSIARLILLFVPIGMLFLPLAHIKVDMPFNSIDTNVSVLNLAMDVIAKFEFSILNAAPLAAIIFYALSILGVLVAAVFAILNIPFVSVSCSPKGFKRNVRLSIGGIVGMLISIISFFIFNAQLESMYGAMYSGNIGIGAFLAIVAFLGIIAINIVIKKKDIPVKYKDLSEYIERVEKRKEEIKAMEEQAEKLRREYAESSSNA